MNVKDTIDQTRSVNHNVKLVFLFSFLSSFGRSVWMGNILNNFIYFLSIATEDVVLGFSPTEVLGLTSGAAGLTMTLFVLPSGYLSDKFSRSKILKLASLFGLAAIFFTAFAENIYWIFIAMLFWGTYRAGTRPALESILADSVRSGNRSGIYSKLHLVRQFAMASGPFFNVILFIFLGDVWELTVLKSVMAIGLLISFISLIAMFFFKDELSLGNESEALTESLVEEPAESQTLFHQQIEETKVINPESRFFKVQSLVPFILVGSNVIIGFGAGMTIKFFPVFFYEIYGLLPIAVQLIYGFTAIFTGLSALVAQRYSETRGRALAIFVVQFLATICLFIIALYPPVIILAPIFIARGSLMNASQPLSRSILMDVVPKRNRGKWNSLEAIAWGLFWNISAVIGGFLIGPNNDFRLCFLVTTGLYILGTVPILTLVPLVRKETTKAL